VNRAALSEDLAALFGHDLADSPAIVGAQLRAMGKYDATGRVPSLRLPALVMSAPHDPIAPPKHGRALAAAIPGASFMEFEDASHGLPIQHAGKVNDCLRNWLHRQTA
jgi:pimeloyl-ACP methyl ester carboxylesterase